MSNDRIHVGDVVQVITSPGFSDLEGTPTDPSTVLLYWRVRPWGGEWGTLTMWEYGTDPEIDNSDEGVYSADIPILVSGFYEYAWVGIGGVDAAEKGTFRARPTFAALEEIAS